MNTPNFSVWLIHPKDSMCTAFERRFQGLPNVEVCCKTYEDLPPHDCFVTAGNAYGIMTAGIDAAVVRYFGEEVMKKIQLQIMDQYLGEQPVGTAFLLTTGNADRPYLAHAPTMRVPGSIRGTDKIYSAAWASFLAVHAHNIREDQKIETLAFPALGTGFGGVGYDEAARQMAVAYRHYLDPPHRMDWDFVAERQKAICYDGKAKIVQ